MLGVPCDYHILMIASCNHDYIAFSRALCYVTTVEKATAEQLWGK